MAEKKSFKEIEREIDEILGAYDDTMDSIEDPDERARAEEMFTDKIHNLGQEESEKVDAYGHAFSKLDAEIARLKKIANDQNDRRKVLENRRERIERYLAFVFNFHGRKSIDGQVYRAKTHLSKTVEVVNMDLIPANYLRIIPETREPDKMAIKAAAKSNINVPGTRIDEHINISVGSR